MSDHIRSSIAGWSVLLARGATTFLLLILAFAISLPLMHPLAWFQEASQSGSGTLSIGLAVVAASFSWILCLHTCRRAIPFPPVRFVSCMIVAFLCLHIALAIYVRPVWGGDYLRYWNSALQLASSDAIDVGSSLYRQRSLPIFYPLAVVFGDVPLAVTAANVGALLLTWLLLYDVMRLSWNHQAAQGLSILLILAPIPAYEALIPSHNLWGIFFAALTIWLAIRAWRVDTSRRYYWFRVIAFSTTAAVTIELTEIQRGSGMFLAAALLTGTTVGWLARTGDAQVTPGHLPASQRWKPFAIALICVTLFAPVALLSTKLGFRVQFTDALISSSYMKLAAHGGTLGNARSDSYARFDERFRSKRLQGPTATADFAKSIVVSSWGDPQLEKVRFIYASTPRLFDLGYPSDWNVSLKSPVGLSNSMRTGLVVYADVFGLILAILFVLSSAYACLRIDRVPLAILILLLYVSAVATVLLTVFENKSPNLFPLWLAAPALCMWAVSAAKLDGDRWRSLPLTLRAVSHAVIGLAIAATIMAAVMMSSYAFFTDGRGRILQGWLLNYLPAGEKQSLPATTIRATPRAFDAPYYEPGALKAWVLRDAAGDSTRLAKYATDNFTVLELPTPPKAGDTVSMSKRVCAEDPDRNDLEFFLFSSYKHTGRASSFFVDVVADGQRYARITIPLPEKSMQLVTVNDVFPNLTCKEVSIRVVANVTRNARSWQRASHVEVWLPRMVDASPSPTKR